MVRILVIEHHDGADARRFGSWLAEAGAELARLRPDRGDPVPEDLDGFHALMVMGGAPGPQDDDTHPWLPATRALQRRTAAAGQPSFNICLGGELAAVAHGAPVRRRVHPQAGVLPLRRRPEASDDPVFAAMPHDAKAILWHQLEIVEPPAGAVHLVEGTDAPVQAFRIGRACWATQFHPEPDEEILRFWSEHPDSLSAVAGRSTAEGDPLYGIRNLLRAGEEHLTDRQRARLKRAWAADERHLAVEVAWHCAQQLRACYHQASHRDGRALAEQVLASFSTCPIPEVARLGRTLRTWQREFLGYFDTGGANNGGTETINGLIELHRRIARGFRNRDNYRLPMLLIGGGLFA